MELLNGKAKELFIIWLNNLNIAPYSVMFWDLPTNVQTLYIIEWLDSVRVYVFANRAFAFEEWNFEILGHFTSGFKYESRQKATTEAIKKANELINQTL
jgi:hypothetical protein